MEHVTEIYDHVNEIIKIQRAKCTEADEGYCELVEQLEDPEIELEAALVLYEKGVKLSGSIQKILESAEQRVAQVAADGSLLDGDEASDEA